MNLRPLPDPDDASAPFWEAAARRELVLQRCGTCEAFRHPPRPMCPSCTSFESVWEPANGRATLWSWVIVHPPVLPAFAERVPYNVAVVELPEGVRMVGNVLGVRDQDLTLGMDLVVTFEDAGEGMTLPQWSPA